MKKEIQNLKPWVRNSLLLIFVLTLAFRLYFAYQTPYFSDSEAYLNLRHINSISEGNILFKDPLSFSGKTLNVIPVVQFLFVGFKVLFGDIIFKIIPEIFACLLIFLVFFIAKRLSNNDLASLFAAFSVAFMPLLFRTFFNNISQNGIFILLVFYLFYCFIRLEEKSYFNQFVFLIFLLPLINSYYFVILFIFIIYLLLIKSESLNLDKLKTEAIIFMILLGFLLSFVLFKKAWLSLGWNIFWQNTPTSLLSYYFTSVNILGLIFSLGLISLLFGVYGIYFGVLKKKNPEVLLFASICLTILILSLLKLVRLDLGMMLFGIALIILSSLGYANLFEYLKITKLGDNIKTIKIGLFVLLFLSSFIPSIIVVNSTLKDTITDEQYNALLWLRNESDRGGKTLSSYYEGNYISSIALWENALDDNFLYAKNTDKAFDELKEVYTTESLVKAREIVKKYDVRYIYITNKTKELYGIEEVELTKDESCFRRAWKEGETEIYKFRNC
ncbi:MAG: hypothetical protein PHE43_03055 [Candidatus Nanoarchaeia archaeon]|nr:hypothetical protein [Candidatus Nanoarchaeia archaeon]